jgi:hypothetical protein
MLDVAQLVGSLRSDSSAYISFICSWTNCSAIALSPTAVPTRLLEPDRTSFATNAKLIFSWAQVRHGLRRRRKFHFIDVTPGPPFAWLEGCDDGVARVMEMSRGVAARRTVATADVATAQAEPEMDPRRAQFQALFTPKSVRRNGIHTGQVVTAHGRSPKVRLWLILPRYGRSIERPETSSANNLLADWLFTPLKRGWFAPALLEVTNHE